VSSMLARRILIIDPSMIFYEGLCRCLGQGACTAMAQAQSPEELLQGLNELHPDLSVIGPNLAEHESLAVCRALIARHPGQKGIIITEHWSDTLFLVDAAQAGAAACVRRRIGFQQCLDTISMVMAGHQLFSREVLVQAFQNIGLTAREVDMVKCMAEGKTDREIASALSIAPRTARNHAQHVLEKLSVHDRKEAVRRARRRGWV